ncbi:MAG: SpoIIE family protein phosphatase [Bacteroidales bacterium]|nr:SpoIIE family protein phosphatase [Bacteroidales bacterium]
MKLKDKILRLLLILLVVSFQQLFSQNNALKFDRISLNDGLSNSIVHCVLNDSKGFMWFGTDDGLNKFDGYKFTIYRPVLGDTTSIANNIIKCIYEDKQGVLWIGTAGGGLNKFNRDSETFTRYTHDVDNNQSLSDNNVYALFEDSKSNFWVGTFGGGLNLMDRETGTFKHFKHNSRNKKSISGDAVRAITEDRNSDLWIGVDEGGIARYDRSSGEFTCFLHDPENANSISSNAVLTIFIDHKGCLWIGTWAGGVNYYDPDKDIFTLFKNVPENSNSISSNETFSIYEDIQNRIWLTTRNGIDIYSPDKKTFIHNVYDPYNAHTISHNFGTFLYEDNTGVLWIGTGGGGLNKYDQYGKKFRHNKKDITSNNSLCADDVYAFYEDKKNNIWIGTKGGGVDLYNPANKTFKHFPPHTENGLNNGTVRSIQQDKNGLLWLGTDGGGINILDPLTEKVVTILQNNPEVNSLKNNAIYNLHIDKTGIVWIGTYGGGLSVYNPVNKQFRNYPINNRNQMQNVVLDIEEDARGRIWIGTLGMGLYEFDKTRNKLISYKKYIKDSSTLSNLVINDIFIDRKGILWLATGGNGLDKFDLRKGTIVNYNESHGLNNNVVSSILEDEKYNFWVGTNNGLSKFDPYTETFSNYSVSDGLQDLMFNPRAALKAKNHQFYFGGINGFNVFDPDSIFANTYVPEVVLTDFKLYNTTVQIGENSPLKKHISEVDMIVLSHSQNVLSFEFAALHYVAPSKNHYRYKLEGFDNDWIYTSSARRFAAYTNLPGGEFIFRVQATNNDGVWNDNGVALKIIIVPPFWKTLPFYGLLTLIFIGLVYLFIKQREKQYRRKEEVLEDKVRIRTEEIKTQKEELMLINEQLNQQQEELKSQSEYLKQINKQLNNQTNQLQFKSDMLSSANQELKKKNQTITESLKYAQKIQYSILPHEAKFKKIFSDFFVVYLPKDIVSGDFFWLAEVKDDEWGKPVNITYVAAVDCTGHGVPGAFMSMIGHTLLNEIVGTKCIRKPSLILKELNKDIITALAKDGKDYQDDGMDITLCAIDHQLEEIQIASAMQAMYLFRKGELTIIEGDIFSIGELLSIIKNPDFTNHIFEFEEGDIVYLFSDGIQDQFGGENGGKFMESQLRDLMKRIHHLKFSEQKMILEKTIDDWKKDSVQIDDMMLIGIKL